MSYILNFKFSSSALNTLQTTSQDSIPFLHPEPTAVTNLMASAVSSESILLTWSLPLNPNGPISGYQVFYRVSGAAQSPPITNLHYVQSNTTERILRIAGLTVYTYYAVHVQAIGSAGGQLLLGNVDKEVVVRTHEASELSDSVYLITAPNWQELCHSLQVCL